MANWEKGVWEENGDKEVEKQSQTLGRLKDWEDREWFRTLNGSPGFRWEPSRVTPSSQSNSPQKDQNKCQINWNSKWIKSSSSAITYLKQTIFGGRCHQSLKLFLKFSSTMSLIQWKTRQGLQRASKTQALLWLPPLAPPVPSLCSGSLRPPGRCLPWTERSKEWPHFFTQAAEVLSQGSNWTQFAVFQLWQNSLTARPHRHQHQPADLRPMRPFLRAHWHQHQVSSTCSPEVYISASWGPSSKFPSFSTYSLLPFLPSFRNGTCTCCLSNPWESFFFWFGLEN